MAKLEAPTFQIFFLVSGAGTETDFVCFSLSSWSNDKSPLYSNWPFLTHRELLHLVFMFVVFFSASRKRTSFLHNSWSLHWLGCRVWKFSGEKNITTNFYLSELISLSLRDWSTLECREISRHPRLVTDHRHREKLAQEPISTAKTKRKCQTSRQPFRHVIIS